MMKNVNTLLLGVQVLVEVQITEEEMVMGAEMIGIGTVRQEPDSIETIDRQFIGKFLNILNVYVCTVISLLVTSSIGQFTIGYLTDMTVIIISFNFILSDWFI
jgi:hypothetical protein